MNPRLKENPIKRGLAKFMQPIIRFLSSYLYVKLQYRYITGHKLNLSHPSLYTEKLQYLRLFVDAKDPKVVAFSDRVQVRDEIKALGLEGILIPDYGHFHTFQDIDFSSLPPAFVLKCSHASGFNEIVINKDKMNYAQSQKKFSIWLKKNYGKETVEPHYSRIKPQILIEKYIGESNRLPDEFKIHVFNGVARYLYIVTGRGEDIRYNNYYIDKTPFPEAQFNGWQSRDENQIAWPREYQKMISIAELIAQDFPFVRVDLYSIKGKIYFGECTFTPAKGTLRFDNPQADKIIGQWLKIN